MRALVLVAALGVGLSAASADAQTPAAPAQTPAAPAQTPATTPPAGQTPPAAPAAAAAPAPVPFPAGAKFAYINLPQLTATSVDGKAAATTYQAETKKKQAEAEAKAKKMQADQQRLETGGSVMSADARAALEKDIANQQRDGERFEQDAQAELNELQQVLQNEYNKKLFPVLEKLAKDFGLQMLFSAAESGLIWAEPGMDLTQEAVKRMDATPTPKGILSPVLTPLPPAAAPSAAPPAAPSTTAPGAAPRPAAPAPSTPARPPASTTK
ncbi:MAG TPA: OmpH family outer membrane protein [Vicinamibacterales bacterium]|nr:OmpH family outer membrane protein [Vicinamibacterales bacterium]